MLLLIDPATGLFVLALRAMAVLAGMVLVMFLLALGAAVDMAAHGLGATGTYVLNGLPMAGKQPVLVFGEIFRAMQTEDVRWLRHTRFTGLP